MKIDNRTHYVTSDLKAFILRGIKESVKSGEDNRTQMLTVKVVYSRNREWGGYGYSGYAFYNGRFMRVRVPKIAIDMEQFARLVMHEYDHIVGYRHKQMDGQYDTAWVKDYEIRIQAPKVKEKIDVRAVRYERTKKLLEKKQTQMKRLQTSIKKYSKKIKYYEKMMSKGNVTLQTNTVESEVKENGQNTIGAGN
jgi:hypothetical protein